MTEYYNIDHAKQRLQQCVVQLDDKYVYVHAIDGTRAEGNKFKVVYSNLSDDKAAHHAGFLPKQQVSTKNLRLGYVNAAAVNSSIYISRQPERMWKEGLAIGNLHFHVPGNVVAITGSRANAILLSPDLDNTLKGKYPEYDRAKKMLKDRPVVAFSRQFAIDCDENLHFRSLGIVGICRKYPELKDKFFYLRELLEQEMH